MQCARGQGLQACFPDVDGDGVPGMTMQLPTEGTIDDPGEACSEMRRRGIPLAPDLAVLVEGGIRSDELAIAVRAGLGGSGVLGPGCEIEDGVAIVDFLDSRALSCMREAGTRNLRGATAGQDEPCEPEELRYMDQNMPVYEVLQFGRRPLGVPDRTASRGPRFRLRRMGDMGADAACSDVYAAVAADN